MKGFLALALVALVGLSFAVCAAAQSREVIISFGDSITASGVWQKLINDRLGTDIINMGVGGENSEDGLARLDAALAKKPDVVILFFGANDSARDMAKGRSIDVYISNMEKMIDAFQSAGADVICVMQSYFYADDYYTRHDKSVFDEVGGIEAYMDSYIEAFRELAKRKGCYIADVRALCDNYSNRREVLADGVHPNSKGYGLYAKAVGDVLVSRGRGDVDGDGKTNVDDYIAIRRHILKQKEIDKKRIPFADIDGDGSITVRDYISLRRSLLGNK